MPDMLIPDALMVQTLGRLHYTILLLEAENSALKAQLSSQQAAPAAPAEGGDTHAGLS